MLTHRVSLLVVLALVWLAWLLQLPPRPDWWLVSTSGLPLLAIGSCIAAARAGQPWRRFIGRTADFHGLAVVLLFALGVQFEDTHGITTDGVTYFSQLRSVIFDRDLDVTREFAYLEQPARPVHIVPIGPIPVWLPLYLMVAAVDALGRAAAWWPVPEDSVAIGLTLPYVRAALVSSFAVAASGLIVVHRRLRREFAQAPAFAATLLLLGGTSLFWYMVYEPAMTHAVSFGVVALFVAAAANCDPRAASPRQMRLVGVFLGLAFITRPQEAVFVLLPAIYVLALSAPWTTRRQVAGRYAWYGLAGFAPFLLLQLLHSYVLFSREDLALVGQEGFLSPFRSRWSETLWSSWHGFLSWTPVAYVALVGTIAYAKLSGRWALAAVLIVFAMAWINGSTPDLGSGWSFGGRRFVSCLVLLAPGLALIATGMIRRPMWSIALLAAGALSWNYLLMLQYRDGLLPKNAAVSFTEVIRQQGVVHTRPPYFYPFAFPANAWFAWRHGLPIDRYDLLGVEPLYAGIDLALEGHAGRFLLDGWGLPTGEHAGSAWWIDGSPATLTLPLKLPDDRAVRVQIRARSRLVTPVVRATLALHVNGREVGRFTADAEQPSVASISTPREVWIDGFNKIALISGQTFWPVAIYRITISAE